MDEDSQDHHQELEKFIRRLIERSIGKGVSLGSGFRIIIAGGEIPIGISPHTHQDRTMTYEPPAEVFTHHGEVLVVTELPGVEEGHLHLQVTGTTLHIGARGHECRYEAVINLPKVNLDSMSYHLKNGVLEVRFRIAEEGPMSDSTTQAS